MRHAVVTPFLSLAVAGLLAGCPDRSISEVNPLQGRVEFKDIPVKVNRDIDLLFVIDDSPSMGDKQKNLSDNFPTFIKVLAQIPGGLPNVHIAVVTSDLGAKGAEDAAAGPNIGVLGKGGCFGLGKNGSMQLSNNVMTNGEQFLSDVLPDGATVRSGNFTAVQPPTDEELATAFGKLARVGAGGCGFEQHLEAIRQALQPSNAVNAGFLRKDAFLAVIIIADEDDCSMSHSTLLATATNPLGPLQSFRCTRFGVLCNDGGQTTDAMNVVGAKGQCHPNDDSAYLTKVADYATFLKGLKDDPNKVIVAGIMGTNDSFATELRVPEGSKDAVPALRHSCTYVGGDGQEVADPPVRLQSFLNQFPNRNTFASICQQDLSGGLQQIAELLKSVVGDPCIEGKLADVDPKTDGAQYDCAVSAVQKPGTADQIENVLPKCTPETGPVTNSPCWHLLADADKCKATDDHLLLKIEGQDTLPTDTHVIANCVTEVNN